MTENTWKYASSDYWGGYELGRDPSPLTVPLASASIRLTLRDMAVAREACKNRLTNMEAYHPFKKFSQGDALDANEYAPGTVLLVEREWVKKGINLPLRLAVKGLTKFFPNPTPDNVEKPSAILRPSLKVYEIDDSVLRFHPGITHYITTEWSMVAAGEQGHYFRNLPTGLAFVASGGEARVRPFPHALMPAKFMVGEVMGRCVRPGKAGQPSPNYFQRITKAEYAGLGGKRKRVVTKATLKETLGQMGLQVPELLPKPVQS